MKRNAGNWGGLIGLTAAMVPFSDVALYEEQMWQGTPVLVVSGPGIDKQPLPTDWLKHSATEP